MESLAPIKKLQINPALDLLEDCAELAETSNLFEALGDDGTLLCLVCEEKKPGWKATLTRSLLRELRPFSLSVHSLEGDVVLQLSRPFRFLRPEVFVSDNHGKPIGSVRKDLSGLNKASFSVRDFDGDLLLTLAPHEYRCDVYCIRSEKGKLGELERRLQSSLVEKLSNTETYILSFPKVSSLQQKTLLFAAVFLIDGLYFSARGN